MKRKHKVVLMGACGVVAISAVMLVSDIHYLDTENGITSIVNHGANDKTISVAKTMKQEKNGDITFMP